MTRREFLQACAALSVPLPPLDPAAKPIRVAVIADLHHGFAPDAMARFQAFERAVRHQGPFDFALQLGDFCHPGTAAEELTRPWRDLPCEPLNVLGNHDMDKGSKDQIMRQWGMPSRFGARTIGPYRWIWLDLNHYREKGQLGAYEKGNWYRAGLTHEWADPEQLQWLERELGQGAQPTVLLSHQPVGLFPRERPMPESQAEIFAVIRRAAAKNPDGRVIACLSGHLHVDHFERVDGIPCVSINSASYFWQDRMHPYADPLFAILEFDPKGELRVLGRRSRFKESPPRPGTPGMSASIADRTHRLSANSGTVAVFSGAPVRPIL